MFSRDIRNQSSLDKCRIQAIRKAHQMPHSNQSVDIYYIQDTIEADFCKFLEMIQGTNAHQLEYGSLVAFLGTYCWMVSYDM